VDPRHRAIAAIALEVGGPFGFALAGGYAVHAHGIGERPSGDVDLFTDWHRRADFPGAVDAVIKALEQNNYSVRVLAHGDTFARLLVATSHAGETNEPDKIELAADWRANPPVMLDVGPVLHLNDAVANKMCALYGRALPRDFLDIDAVLRSGRFSREELLELGANADNGFTPFLFSQAIGALAQISDAAFAEYGVGLDEIAALRRRFNKWREVLIELKNSE
jgi:hypothetical protein